MTDFAQISLVLAVVLPAVVGGLLTFSRRAGPIAVPVSLATAGTTLALSVIVAFSRPRVALPFMAGTDFGFAVDALSALIVPTVAAATFLVLAFSAADIREAQSRFHGMMLLFAASAVLTATATTLPALLLAWEVMGAVSYALIGFLWRDEHRVSAGLTAFVTTRTADLGLYIAAGAALAGGAGLALADLSGSSPRWRHVIAAGVLVAALGKAAQLPFSFWLSRAMEGPSPVSALLHSAAMVAMGGYLLLRAEPLLAATGWASSATAWMGGATALLLGAVALAQRDLKQLLAASTAAQLGFVVMGAGLGSIMGGATQLVAHAATKALLFVAAGAWLSALGTKHLDGLRGVARRWRLVGWSVTAGALALAGVAPLSLWATKDAILTAALEESPWLYVVGMGAAALSAAYAGKILVIIWRRTPAGHDDAIAAHFDEERQGTRTIGMWEKAPLAILACGAAVLGVLALPPVGTVLASALGGGETPDVLELAASAVLAGVVVLAVVRWPVTEPRWAVGWFGLENAAYASIVRPTLRLAHLLARFDDKVLDRAVEAVAAAVPRAAARAASTDDKLFDGTVEAFARQMRRLGQLVRRPQTGQLHHYYFQAVVLLALGIFLLVTVR